MKINGKKYYLEVFALDEFSWSSEEVTDDDVGRSFPLNSFKIIIIIITGAFTAFGSDL